MPVKLRFICQSERIVGMVALTVMRTLWTIRAITLTVARATAKVNCDLLTVDRQNGEYWPILPETLENRSGFVLY